MIIPSTNIKQTVNILPQLKTTSLLSVGKLVDDGCVAQFTKNKATIYKNNKTILQGKINLKDGLYDIKFKIKTNTNNKIFTDTQQEKKSYNSGRQKQSQIGAIPSWRIIQPRNFIIDKINSKQLFIDVARNKKIELHEISG